MGTITADAATISAATAVTDAAATDPVGTLRAIRRANKNIVSEKEEGWWKNACQYE
jgi:hypothetical protein